MIWQYTFIRNRLSFSIFTYGDNYEGQYLLASQQSVCQCQSAVWWCVRVLFVRFSGQRYTSFDWNE
jgi:hypothetical protein